MKGYSKQLYIKLFLIMVSEGAAFTLTDIVSTYITSLYFTTATLVLLGGILAVIVVSLYDLWLHMKKKPLIEKELRKLTDAAILKYETESKNKHKQQ